jgi:hypothetical protein
MDQVWYIASEEDDRTCIVCGELADGIIRDCDYDDNYIVHENCDFDSFDSDEEIA